MSWYFGLDSSVDLSALNQLIENSSNVIMFFDKNVLKLKEIVSLFELLILREVDNKVKIIPVAIGIDPTEVPKFLLRRMIFVEKEFSKEVFENILKIFFEK